jgi:hypothetical protein
MSRPALNTPNRLEAVTQDDPDGRLTLATSRTDSTCQEKEDQQNASHQQSLRTGAGVGRVALDT